jgi:SAM-dependent methyltransferase
VLGRLRPRGGADKAFPSLEAELLDYEHLFSGRVLNAGAGHRDLSPLVEGEVVNQDIEGPADIVSTIHAIPVEDASFDAVICNAVLEHLYDPEAAVRELHRVLRPGGTVYMAVSFMQPEHLVPTDSQRYTHDGLRELCERLGFDVVDVTGIHSAETTLAWVTYEWLRRETRLLPLVFAGIAYEWFARRGPGSTLQVRAIQSTNRVIAMRR